MSKRGGACAAAVTPISFLSASGSRQSSNHPTPSPTSPTKKKVRCPEVVKYTVSKADSSGLAGLLRTQKSDSDNPLVLAAYYGHAPLVQHLVQRGYDMNKSDEKHGGQTALFISAAYGHLSIVKFLIQRGADVDRAAAEGDNPLYIAAHQGHLDVVKCLVENGARCNQATIHGDTPLHIASYQGHLAIVQYLVECSNPRLQVDVNQENHSGWTPLAFASHKGHTCIARYLEDQGATL